MNKKVMLVVALVVLLEVTQLATAEKTESEWARKLRERVDNVLEKMRHFMDDARDARATDAIIDRANKIEESLNDLRSEVVKNPIRKS
ncbi:hypothetical protein HDE_09011 [Halotydeus destructor]|nr:hypothetical protein HDE_09011 [Halotydeus destructor]